MEQRKKLMRKFLLAFNLARRKTSWGLRLKLHAEAKNNFFETWYTPRQ
jgi:hypothetical protein